MPSNSAAYMREYRAKRKFRASALAAFGVTEDEVAGLGADGYAEARAEAERERSAYVAQLEREIVRLQAELTAKLGDPVRFSTRSFTPAPKPSKKR
jgi:hypothetical protein